MHIAWTLGSSRSICGPSKEAEAVPIKSSILIVVGRQDTGDLEAQVRGSRHAWEIRLISVDALLQLMNRQGEARRSRDCFQDPSAPRAERVHDDFDAMVNIALLTAADVSTDLDDAVDHDSSIPGTRRRTRSYQPGRSIPRGHRARPPTQVRVPHPLPGSVGAAEPWGIDLAVTTSPGHVMGPCAWYTWARARFLSRPYVLVRVSSQASVRAVDYVDDYKDSPYVVPRRLGDRPTSLPCRASSWSSGQAI